MSRLVLIAAIAIVSGYPVAQQLPTGGKVGPSAVWQPPKDFISKAQSVCGKGAGPASFPVCFLNQVEAAAPADAASFTRRFYKEINGEIGILQALKPYKGAVAAAQVLYPLRANTNFGLLLINGDPQIIDVDDLQKLDRGAMENAPVWQQLKQKYANADLWPGDRSGDDPWPQWEASPDGGSRFVVQYPIINGCHACARVGQAQFAWDLDRSGKFVHVTYVGLRTTTF